ncbi:MAG: YdjY domain-containing protein [Phycisphaerae bacterium]
MKLRETCVLAILLAAISAAAHAQTVPAATQPTQRGDQQVTLPDLKVDLSARRVILSAEVCLRSGALELLVCKAGTKEYESILRTEAQASHLHAALLMLGLSPGLPGEWSDTGADGQYIPPRGAELEVTLRWQDRSGEARESPATAWLKPDDGTDPPRQWVFVGSEILPDGRYWADVDGDVLSVSNFPSAVIDVPFRSTTENELLLFEADSEKIPPVGTEVDVIIEPVPGADTADYARALLEIDRYGRLRMDGEPLEPDELTAWAEEFTTRHSKARVVIRPDPQALLWDVTRARFQLRLGGIRDFDLRYLQADHQVLPRTQTQSETALGQWREKFENPRDYIREPGQEAQRELQRVIREIDRLELRRELLRQYAADLREELDQYRAATQPAEQSMAPMEREQ